MDVPEDIVAVTREAEASVLDEVHVLVNALRITLMVRLGRGFDKVTFGLHAVDEGHPFGPRVGGAQGFCGVGGEILDCRGGTVAEEPLGFKREGFGKEKRGERHRCTEEVQEF